MWALMSSRRWALLAFALFCLLAWATLSDYNGLVHDSRLYTFQALARLMPVELKHDVFLRFGSQDRFTVFSPLYSVLINRVGVDNAALIVTITSNLGFLGAVWMLARRFYDEKLSLLAVGLIIVIPSYYGAERVFRYMEPFATPRIFAEALVIAAISQWYARRRLVAGALQVSSFLLHPLMAAAGAAFLGAVWLLEAWSMPSRRRALGLGLAVMAAVGVCLVLSLPRFDPVWFKLVADRSKYLFLAQWSLDDWTYLCPRATTLLLGAMLIRNGELRRAMNAAMALLILSLAASYLSADLLKGVLAVQSQMWRATWLCSVLCVISLPSVARDGWGGAVTHRASMLFLVCAWTFEAPAPVFLTSMLSLMAAAIPMRPDLERWTLRLGWLVCAIAAIWLAADLLATNITFFGEPQVSPAINAIRLIAVHASPGVAVVVGMWLLATRSRRYATVASFLVVCFLAAAAGGSLYRDWFNSRFSEATYAAFAPWRALIPRESEILLDEGANISWFLLNRASYLSSLQVAGVVFSREAAIEMDRRAEELKVLGPPEGFLSWQRDSAGIDVSHIGDACRSSRVDFIAARIIGDQVPFARMPATAPIAYRQLALFRCADYRT